MRVVLDTNIWVSYLLTHRPPISTIIDVMVAEDEVILVTSIELLEELKRVLNYPKLKRFYSEKELNRFIALAAAISEFVELPDDTPRICRDPKDDMVIAGAVAGAADVIVSGDVHLLEIGRVGNIPIVTARQLVDSQKR